MLNVAGRIDRMVKMFEHAIIVCVNPQAEGLWRLQGHLKEAG